MFNFDNATGENQNMSTMENVEGTDTMESTKSMTTTNPQDLISEDEKAISIDWNALNVDVISGNIEKFVPEEEKALMVNPEENERMARQLRATVLAGMGHIQGVLNDRLYGLIMVDETEKRTFVFCFDQDNGVPTRFEISQADLFRLAYAEFDLSKMKAYDQKKMNDVMHDLENRVLNTWVDSNRPLPLPDVMEALYRSRNKLPVVTRVPIDNKREMYERIKEALSSLGGCYVEKKAYYAFYPDQVYLLAEKLGMKERPLLKKLEELNLLYLQPSCVGYQARVRIDENNNMRMVCIYRLEYFPQAAGGYAEEAKEDEEQTNTIFEKIVTRT